MYGAWLGVISRPWYVAVVGLAVVDLAILFVTTLWVWRATRAGGQIVLRALCILVAAASAMDVMDHIASVFRTDPPVISTPLSLQVDGSDITMTGDIGFPAYDALGLTLAAHPDATRLILTSDGGRIPAARGLARLVRDAGLDTHVTGTCASACTLVYVAGRVRTLGANGRLGFHGYQLNSTVRTLDPDQEQARDVAAFIALGADAGFMDRAMAVPHDQMWFPDRAELIAAGVVTND